MSTAAEREAERRYPPSCCLHADGPNPHKHECKSVVEGQSCCCVWVDNRHYTCDGYHEGYVSWRIPFIAGAEWSESRYRELLEAAREYRDKHKELTELCIGRGCSARLLAAAAALEERTTE